MNLHEHINQNGVTYGPAKYALMLKACELMGAPPFYTNENVAEPVALVRIFDPCGSWTWYVEEYDAETGEAFGLVDGHEMELGYFSLKELSEHKGPMGIGLEVDVWFTPTPISVLKERGAK